ncbi:MBL fold metallo-hydrolase [Variovorax sp. PAMC 28711]|uniref:MBL fold metallo-hydrolase n=1 Tax=Variovorax sp. PAMC 28711 TaxID=1795631 RepID=UPI00078B2685|nr:MBL fold metallo-hydrolase [Variovorax sp. PAMC 28711]AMM25772.1 MBL fold metallo-hydrolase [Variovorax sp. PAMC 28711]
MLRSTFLRTALASATLALVGAAHAAQPLQLMVHSADTKSMFPVASELITGATEAVLIDAQFQRNDAEALVQKIKASGKKLTTVYISHSDPDYYFGLDVVHAAFPDARIVATAPTVAAIQASKDGKLAHWGPILKDNAPKTLVVPEVLAGDTITLEGRQIRIVGLDVPTPARSFAWIPSLKTVVGGIPVSNNIHVWIADTQSAASRKDWLQTLDRIDALRPRAVVPGHALPAANGKVSYTTGVAFTRGYLKAFETEAAKAKDSVTLIAAMKKRYPTLSDASSLDLSAKVIKGDMKWPQ